MKLGHTEVFVRDPEQAREFYTEVLGFEIVDIQEGGFTWLSIGDREVLLRPQVSRARSDPAELYGNARLALVFYTDDLAKTKSELETRGLDWGQPDGSDRCLTFQDPDGNWFQLVDPNEH